MKSILIVEDDVLISEQLKRIVQDCGHSVSKICPSLISAKFYLEDALPDMALLDIRMNGIDEGIEVAKTLNQLNVPFAFITSFSDRETLLEAISLRPVGYVVKPYTKDDVKAVLENGLKLSQSDFITIKDGYNRIRIEIDKILFLHSENVYVNIFTVEKKFIVREKLETIITQINKPYFVRVHRSYGVNLKSIDFIGKNILKISNTEIPVSKNFKENIQMNP